MFCGILQAPKSPQQHGRNKVRHMLFSMCQDGSGLQLEGLKHWANRNPCLELIVALQILIDKACGDHHVVAVTSAGAIYEPKPWFSNGSRYGIVFHGFIPPATCSTLQSCN